MKCVLLQPWNISCAYCRLILQNITDCFSYVMYVNFLLVCSEFRPKKEMVNAIHCHALDDSPLRPKGLDIFDNPRERFNSREVKFITPWSILAECFISHCHVFIVIVTDIEILWYCLILVKMFHC